MKNLGLIVIVLILTSFQCTKDIEDPLVNQQILFARIYENQAWGHQLEGWFIDNTGFVRGFSLGRNPQLDWNRMSDAGYISLEKLTMNFNQTDTTFTKVPLQDLFNYYSFIDDAAKGALTEKQGHGNDMGQESNYCLLYFPVEKQYKFVLLESTGDWEIHNIAPYAGRINAWLDRISNDINNTGTVEVSGL